MKIHATWIKEGDNNQRKDFDTIWDIVNWEGERMFAFQVIAKGGSCNYSKLFINPLGFPIQWILHSLQLIPHLFIEEMNDIMMEKVPKAEILTTLLWMKRGKSLGLKQIIVEYYLGLYNVIKDALIKIIWESQTSGKFLGSLNSTFISLYQGSRTFSLLRILSTYPSCNIIYNLISKIIS